MGNPVTLEVLNVKVEHIEGEMVEMKSLAKDQGTAMVLMRDSHLETKFYIKNIQESQAKMAIDATAAAKLTKDYQDSTLAALQAIKDAKGNYWEKLSWAWKAAIITVITGLIGSYIWGTITGYLRLTAKG